ncbi:trehalose phosphatase [Pseudomonas sp. KNUC1026]|uniref:trehalose phosphatase n=1 Tax=Pseudomonas sp. KNUC1026 TaxID=2893890 RepID=UPI001F455D08|nr:trehalose phosphatase [Pseudomonas sp. KNUC1026]UFH50798.1 trehalose phosphatase [Pseudomonas sp. KNUC1026]
MACKHPLVLVDLDDTLFQTARKMPSQGARYPASYDLSGNISGYQTPVQKAFADWLLHTAEVIPVTARSAEAFSRVQVGFNGAAICAHGGLILNPDRTVDAQWHALMNERLAGYRQRLPQLRDSVLEIGTQNSLSLRSWVIEEAQQRHYVVVKHCDGSDAELAFVERQLRGAGLLEGMHTHLNGNNLALMPAGLSKRAAVEHYLKTRLQLPDEQPVIGIGDSLSDLGFMSLCDFWATPCNSQLARVVESAHA